MVSAVFGGNMRIAIVVPCTASKHEPVGGLRIAQVVGGQTDAQERFRGWREAVSASKKALKARDLYAGPRWQASMRIATAADGPRRDVDLYIASAGLGLIRADRRVPSYSATFSRGSDDSVVAPSISGRERRDATRQWWKALTRDSLSLRVLATDNGRLVVVLSPDYLDAVADDLAKAVEVGGSRVIIFGTGEPTNGALARNWVRVGRHLRETTKKRSKPIVNGLDATLLQSTAALVLGQRLKDWSSARKVQRMLDDLADPNEVTIEAMARAGRQPSTDQDVRTFIRGRLADADRTSAELLSAWRNIERRQCEEGRFKRLFAEVAKMEGARHG